MQLKNSSPYIYIASVFLLNFLLKILFIDAQDIALDEPFSLFHSQRSVSEIFNYVNTSENNPPLYFIVLHYWMNAFGLSPFSVRVLSVLFSALTASVIFKTGEKYFNRSVGIAAALIFTFSTLHIYHSHEARTYALFILLNSLSLFFYLGIMAQPDKKINYVLLFASNIIVIYSHYFGFFIVFTELLLFFLLPNKKEIWKGLILVFSLLLLFYTPHMPAMWEQFSHKQSNGTWVSAPALTEFYGNLNRFLNNKYCMAVLLAVLTIATSMLLKNRHLLVRLKEMLPNNNLKIVFLWFLIPYTLMFLLSFKLPMFIDRYILFTSVPFYIFLAALLFLISENETPRYLLYGALILSLAFTVQLNPDNKRRLKDATTEIKKIKKIGSPVLIAPEYTDLGFAYHYDLNYFKDHKNLRNLLANDDIFPVNSAEMATNILAEYPTECIFLQADTKFSDPNDLILQAISKKYRKHTEKKYFEIYTVHHFSN